MSDDETIYLPPFQTPAKPLYGEPCNGCGWCCHMQVCGIGRVVFPDAPAPCPGIVYEEGRVRCSVVLAEIEDGKHKMVQEMLGVGAGCCSTDYFREGENNV